jgi:hypothetical protein
VDLSDNHSEQRVGCKRLPPFAVGTSTILGQAPCWDKPPLGTRPDIMQAPSGLWDKPVLVWLYFCIESFAFAHDGVVLSTGMEEHQNTHAHMYMIPFLAACVLLHHISWRDFLQEAFTGIRAQTSFAVSLCMGGWGDSINRETIYVPYVPCACTLSKARTHILCVPYAQYALIVIYL